MTCADLDILLCDYLDGTLPPAQRSAVESHLASCAACAQLASDAQAAVSFMARAAVVEPPPELLTNVLYQISREKARTPRPGGLRYWLSQLFGPVLQPRFVMGMALSILSISMLSRFAPRQLNPADLDPVKLWASLDDRAHRVWQRTLKSYESIRFVYQIQSRVREWKEKQQTAEPNQNADAKSEASRKSN